ncbi:helix-turn-helix transcriptional regulator [Enterococcus cecorum]|nr:helix-turn-helix transcriptional regulator [Enterococcus cecorum]CAI3359227.1 helix-turn-helix transcriptional regulator [Enterococcus cecorum]
MVQKVCYYLKVEKIIDNKNVIGSNIRRIRLEKKIGQTELVRELQLRKISITRETLVKIEGGRQHIKLEQLKAIRDILQVSYDELLQ